VECEPRGFQGGPSIIREGTPYGCPGAPHDFGLRIPPSCEAPFQGASPTAPLFACCLGMAGGVIHRLRRLAQSMEVTQEVWPIGAHLRAGPADGPVAVRHEADQRSRHGLLPGPEQDGEVWWGRGQHPAGQEAFPREAVPQDPEPRRGYTLAAGTFLHRTHSRPALPSESLPFMAPHMVCLEQVH
jgi:hypothetical protein